MTVTVNTVTVNVDHMSRVLQVLRAATGRPELSYACPPRPLTGGFWAELFGFSLVDPPPGWPGELVARIMPDADAAGKEMIVQALVASAGFPTPVVRVSGRDESGRAFMVMDRAAGAHLLSGLAGAGAIASAVAAMREMPRLLASTMARLHSLDPAPVRDQLCSSCAIPFTLSHLLVTLREMARDYGRADLTSAAQWLIDNPPPPGPEVICHGDLHPFNLLVDDADVCLLDWTAALLAPRAYDVAFTSLLLAEPPFAVPRALRPVVRRLGARLARRFVARYEQEAVVAVDPRELRWHQSVGCLRALVEVAGWSRQGLAEARAGHPWLVCGPAFARRLTTLTGTHVQSSSLSWPAQPATSPRR
jgi:aminoglycoside phosphotransferase (APT) family kinase protein